MILSLESAECPKVAHNHKEVSVCASLARRSGDRDVTYERQVKMWPFHICRADVNSTFTEEVQDSKNAGKVKKMFPRSCGVRTFLLETVGL